MLKVEKSKKHIAVVGGMLAVMVLISLCIGYGKDEVYADPASYETQIDTLSDTVNTLSAANTSNAAIITSLQSVGYLDEDGLMTKTYESSSVTVAAKGYQSIEVADVTLDGYTAKGVMGFWVSGTNRTYCTVNKLYISGSKVYAVLRNTSTSTSAVVQIHCGVIYAKNK